MPLYPPELVENEIKWEVYKEALVEADNDAYNVVILGPTGSGKSNIINNLFNLTVCETGGSAQSVTRQVTFHQGSHRLWEQNLDTGEILKMRKINIIDTIGNYKFQE